MSKDYYLILNPITPIILIRWFSHPATLSRFFFIRVFLLA